VTGPVLPPSRARALLGSACERLRASSLAAAAALVPKRQALEDDDGAHRLWRWIEDNGEFVFPAIGVVILALVLLAVRRGTLSQQEELRKKTAQKEQLVRLVRARLSLTADACAPELGVDRFHAAALLEELVREGVLAQGRVAGGVATYRLKGL
jgi:hypothetical protein